MCHNALFVFSPLFGVFSCKPAGVEHTVSHTVGLDCAQLAVFSAVHVHSYSMFLCCGHVVQGHAMFWLVIEASC